MKPKRFCNYCHGNLRAEWLDGKLRQVCPACGEVYYENPLPVVSVIVANPAHELLLVRRGRPPFEGMWCLPIGFAETEESVEEAALRELKEEAGIEGRILQVIDVDSHENPVYGDLLIVTYAAEKTGGREAAGDDAVDVAYFPALNLPRLAFDSQEKAVAKFIDLKREHWNVQASFEQFLRRTARPGAQGDGELLSDDLLGLVEKNAARIVDLWVADVRTNPTTPSYAYVSQEILRRRALEVLAHFRAWLSGIPGEAVFGDFYRSLGAERRREGLALEDVLSSFSLLKKHIFRFASSRGMWQRTVDMYRLLELGERVVYFFDRAVFYTVAGYQAAAPERR